MPRLAHAFMTGFGHKHRLPDIETGAPIADLAAQKQALRDVTKTDLSKVSSVEDLKAVRPAVLVNDRKP